MEPVKHSMKEQHSKDTALYYRADDPAIVRALAIAAVVDEWTSDQYQDVRLRMKAVIGEAEARIAKQTTEGASMACSCGLPRFHTPTTGCLGLA